MVAERDYWFGSTCSSVELRKLLVLQSIFVIKYENIFPTQVLRRIIGARYGSIQTEHWVAMCIFIYDASVMVIA